MAPVIHIVLLAFKPEVTAEQQQKTVDEMLALKDSCLHPQTNKPYITITRGGKDHSIEGYQQGITHAFVVEFENLEARDHYVKEAEPHALFVKENGPHFSQIRVIDFTPGSF